MTERIAFVIAMGRENGTRIREMQLEECQDDLHDQCSEIRPSLLIPGSLYVCECSCHD